jgi:Resolvase, N terminal domain
VAAGPLGPLVGGPGGDAPGAGRVGAGFVSLTEALDLTTPSGRAMAGLLAVFAEFEREILRERVRAGIAQAREESRPHGRPRSASLQAEQFHRFWDQPLSKAEIAPRLWIGRSSVRRILAGRGPGLATFYVHLLREGSSVVRQCLAQASMSQKPSEGPGGARRSVP